MKLIEALDNFVRISHAPSKVEDYIRYEIPANYRYYGNGNWRVHLKYLQAVVDYASKICGLDIDTRKLPASITHTLNIESPEDPHSILHVTRSAPLCVVKAAYRALSLKAHPDQGGTTEQAVQLNEAYQQVLSERSGRD